MKTKDLIAALKAADPTGELECCVGNVDIHFVDVMPAYYDGSLQVLSRDQGNPYYNIIGAQYRSNGSKVVIRELSIEDALMINSKLPISYDGEHSLKHYRDKVEGWRKESDE